MHKESEDNIISTASDSVIDLVSNNSIPAPIRKNAIKAFGQLCTALIDIPVAHLEGWASEVRAQTQARVKIISTNADQITEQMSVNPEYARIAVKKYGQKILREQVNLDNISNIAAEEIASESFSNGNTETRSTHNVHPTINSDWINNFEREASQISTGNMQKLFARILAGEIQKPNSFSIKTVKLLRELDSNVARLFSYICSLSISLQSHRYESIDSRVLSFGGNPNSLEHFGIKFETLITLQEYELISSQYDTSIDFQRCVGNKSDQPSSFLYQNHYYVLRPNTINQINKSLRLRGIALSRFGRELLNIVNIKPVDNEYTRHFNKYFFQGLNLQMEDVSEEALTYKRNVQTGVRYGTIIDLLLE